MEKKLNWTRSDAAEGLETAISEEDGTQYIRPVGGEMCSATLTDGRRGTGFTLEQAKRNALESRRGDNFEPRTIWQYAFPQKIEVLDTEIEGNVRKYKLLVESSPNSIGVFWCYFGGYEERDMYVDFSNAQCSISLDALVQVVTFLMVKKDWLIELIHREIDERLK